MPHRGGVARGAGPGRIWIVNHPYHGRRWLEVEARLADTGTTWHRGFIWSEWFQQPNDGDPYLTPTVPTAALTAANIDPLVIGGSMYFDYCRKGSRGKRKNDRKRNNLQRGDLVLFGCAKKGRILIDTVFTVGRTKAWPTRGIPNWSNLDALARAAHFNLAAHTRLHPEVHSTVPCVARSYRGQRYEAGAALFSWVPFNRKAPLKGTGPFHVPKRSKAHGLLREAFLKVPSSRLRSLAGGMQGSFPVVEGFTLVPTLFAALADQARLTGWDLAVEVRLLQDPLTASHLPLQRPLC